MDLDDYERHLVGLLCWACHAATGPCNARQRQCPRCRRKWSHHRERTRWELLKAFCLNATAHHAARCARCDYRTAYRVYMHLRLILGEMTAEEKRPLLGELELDESYFGGKRKGKRGRGAAGKAAKAFVQDVADAVATVAPAKEEAWEYSLPAFEEPVATVTVGLDGTCMLMCDGGRREAMVGTFGFYDRAGVRLHTVYTAATPEYGKLTFFDRFDRELGRAKAAHPDALYVGVADGAKDNWLYLDAVTKKQVVDFYHATQYLWKAAYPLFAHDGAGLRPWVDSCRRRVKHEPGAAEAVAADIEARGAALGKARLPAGVESALTYFRNQIKGGRMNYAELIAANIPIGSGVTEAACKVLVEQRLCGSGMRWKGRGAAAVLSVRCLTYTPERWGQFWARIDRSGFPVAA